MSLRLISFCILLQLFSVAYGETSGVDLLPGTDVCGKQQKERIFGGEETDIGEFPWMALLYFDLGTYEDFMCGGALINNRYVLTAAHCIEDNLIKVRLGEHNVKTKEDCDDGEPGLQFCSDPPVEVEIEEKIVHEKYKPSLSRDDIALLRLRQEVNYTDFIKPVCLPVTTELKNSTFEGEDAVIAGWGKTETRIDSDTLLKVDAPIIPNDSCLRTYIRHFALITEKQICAGAVKGKSSCNGDSGGPLVYLHKTPEEENWIEIGVVSFGLKQCGLKDVPIVYTRVTEYLPWILQNIKP